MIAALKRKKRQSKEGKNTTPNSLRSNAGKAKRLTESFISEMQCSISDEESAGNYNSIKLWQRRERLLSEIKEMHYDSQTKYVEFLTKEIKARIFDEADHKIEFDKFIYDEIVLH